MQEPIIQPPAEPLPPQAVANDRIQAVAGWIHTIVLIVILLAVGYGSAYYLQREGGARSAGGPMLQYVQTLIFQWLLFAYVAWGIKRRGHFFREIIGRGRQAWGDGVRAVVLAGGFFIISTTIRALITVVFMKLAHIPLGQGDTKDMLKSLEPLLPHTASEITVAVALAVTAGIVEETIFRGYLQRQFLAWTGSATLAVLMQGCVFAVGHLYQPKLAVMNVFMLGLMLGIMAHWRKSLRPGMIFHAGQDSLSLIVLGLFGN